MCRVGPASRFLKKGFFFCALLASVRCMATDALYLSDDVYKTIWVIDVDGGQVVGALPFPERAAGATFPRGRSGLGFDGREIFFTHTTSRMIYVIDPGTGGEVRAFSKPPLRIAGLGAVPGALYVAGSSGRRGTILELDPQTGSVLRTMDVPGARDALDASLSRGSIFARVGDFELGEWSASTTARLRSNVLPDLLVGLAFSEATTRLYGVTLGSRLYVLDPEDGKATREVLLTDQTGYDLGEAGGLAWAGPSALDGVREGGGAAEANLLTFRLDVQDVVFTIGETADVPILLSSNAAIEGFQAALVHDASILHLDEITIQGTSASEFGADFQSANIYPNGGVIGVIFDLFPPYENNALPPGDNRVVARYRYSSVRSNEEGELSTQVRFVDSVLGSPVKDNLVVAGGLSHTPELVPGHVTCIPRLVVEGGPEFFCGGPLGADGLPTTPRVRSGERTRVCFYYKFDKPAVGSVIEGLSMAVSHDCRLSCLEGTFEVPADSITAQVGAEFVDFQCENDPDDGDGCEMVLGILVDSLPPFGNAALPPTLGTPLLLACVQLEVGGDVDLDECLELGFRDGLNGSGKVPVKNLVSVDNNSIPVQAHPCSICVSAVGPTFFCGSGRLGADGHPEPSSGKIGQNAEVCLWYSSPGEQVLGLTQAMRYDCALECIASSFQISPDTPQLASAEFVQFACENDPGDGDPCELVLKIIARDEVTGSGTPLPPTNTPQRIGCFLMHVTDRAPPGRCLALMYHDGVTLEGVSYKNEVTLLGGSADPNTFDCAVCLPPAEPPKFLCGGPKLGANGLPEPIREVSRGTRAEFCLWYSAAMDELGRSDEIQGLSMALCYDCNLRCIEDSFRVPDDSILKQVEAEFLSFQCDNDPNDGDGCEMILGLLVEARPPFEGRTLPASEVPLKLVCVDMEVSPSVKPGFCLDVKFCDSINGRSKVPIKNLVSIESVAVKPKTCDCSICVKHLGPKFLCGGAVLGPDGMPEIPRGRSGRPVEFCFWYCSPEDNATTHEQFDELQGFSMALAFDCRLSCIESSFRMPPDSITAALDADYVSFQCDNDPNDGDGCEMILGVLIDTLPPFDGRRLPATDIPLKVGCVNLVLPENGKCGECFDVKFRDGLNGRGKIPIFNQVAVENLSFLAITKDCKVCVDDVLDPVFQRGDCNASNMGTMAVDIADAAEILTFLFRQGAWRTTPPCLDACDVNDDGRIDLADAFAILVYLFAFGHEPPSPGPFSVGPDPTPDKLGCEILNPCL